MGALVTTDAKKNGEHGKLDITERKADHLDLCATDAVAFKQQTTLLEGVRLVHQSLPDLHVDEIDLSVSLLGKKLRAPIVIAAMTGGHERAAEVNHTLAAIANGIDPLYVGELVVEGIEQDWPYIFTDSDFEGAVDARFAQIKAGFDRIRDRTPRR